LFKEKIKEKQYRALPASKDEVVQEGSYTTTGAAPIYMKSFRGAEFALPAPAIAPKGMRTDESRIV